MKRKHLAAAFFIPALLIAAQGLAEESAFTLNRKFRPHFSCTGTIEYSNTSIVSFESKGRLSFVAPVGKYVESSIFDMNGKIVRAGDLLAKQDSGIQEKDLKLAEIQVKEAAVTLEEKREAFLRDQKLYGKRAVSEKQFLETKLKYETAQIAKEKAELEVERCRRVLDACYARAPFNGIVEEVYQLAGAAVDVAHRVLKVSAVSPIQIAVDLPETVTRGLDQTVRVLVFPVDSEIPVQAWFDPRGIGTKKLVCFAENPMIPVVPLTESEKNLPRIDDLSVVTSERQKWAPDMLWIHFRALKQDAEGAYVWKLKGVKALDPRQSIRRINIVKKIRVRASGKETFRGIDRLCGIEPPENLKMYDVLAVSVPDGLKSGEKTVYCSRRLRFRPGETVKVMIVPEEREKCFYVPEKAVLRSMKTGPYVRIRRNGSFTEIPVEVYETINRHFRIHSPDLREGMTVLCGK